MENMQTFKDMLEKLKSDAHESQAAAKQCYSKIRFLVDSTDNNTKMFGDLKKGEVKQYLKTKETFTTRIKRFYDTRNKIESMETQVADLEAEMSQKSLNEKELQAAKNKLKIIHQALLKTKVEYSQMKIDAKDISLEFNQTKHKFVRVFNAYAENVENRVRDNLAFFVQKIGEFLSAMRLNNSSNTSCPQSVKAIDDPLNMSHSSIDINMSALSTQLAENKIIIEEVKFEEERISDPDLYLKFVSFQEGDTKQVTREIEQFSKRCEPKFVESVFQTAANVILGRSYISELISMSANSLEQRSFCIRVAVFLVAIHPKFGKILPAKAADTRDELFRALLSSL